MPSPKRRAKPYTGAVEKMTVEKLSQHTWLEMGDLVMAGQADREDISQASFMAELRPRHPEWSDAELRRWSEGGMWHHTLLLATDPPYCARCDRHYDHRLDDRFAFGYRCST